jgi:hypothetical protein
MKRKNNMKKEINRVEAIDDIETSFINGSFTQAREQIVDAIEGGFNVLDINYEYCHEGLEQFVYKTIVKYLAYTPSLEARQNVLNW